MTYTVEQLAIRDSKAGCGVQIFTVELIESKRMWILEYLERLGSQLSTLSDELFDRVMHLLSVELFDDPVYLANKYDELDDLSREVCTIINRHKHNTHTP